MPFPEPGSPAPSRPVPAVPVVAVDGATTTTGPLPGGGASSAPVGSKCNGPTTTASAGQSGRDTSSAGSVAISRRSGSTPVGGSPTPTRAAARCRRPSRSERAVNRRITVSRNLPRSPTPGASPLPIGGNPVDGRYSGCGFSSTHGSPTISAASAPHAVITSDTIRSGASSVSCGAFSTAIRAARWWILAPASRSSSRGVGSSPSSSIASTPAARAVSSHCTPVSSVGSSPAANNFRHSAIAGNECPGSGPATTATRTGLPCHRPAPLRWRA